MVTIYLFGTVSTMKSDKLINYDRKLSHDTTTKVWLAAPARMESMTP